MAFISFAAGALWAAFIVYWVVSARNVKKNVGPGRWVRGAWIRIAIIIVAIWAVGATGVFRMNAAYRSWFAPGAAGTVWGAVGLAICIIGLGLAVWARVHLGGNWSAFPTLKEGHDLVTSGPYRIVRHPIYSGILLAMAGSVLADGLAWVVALIVFGIIFVWRVHVEEQLMVQEFPAQYPGYKRRTKALIPFIW